MVWGGSGQEDLISPAVAEAMAPVAHLEHDWDSGKLEKRLRGYFRNAAKDLEFGRKPWTELVDEYANRVWSSIFQALHDREWLTQADFLLVLDAGVKETFPRHVLAGIPQHIFERAVLLANDRAFEEQRYLPLLWETISGVLDGPKTKKKAYNAFDEGRKRAAACTGDSGGSPLEAFTEAWITSTVARLAADSSGEPATLVPVDTAVQLFHMLIAAEALPLPLVAENGAPPEAWPFVDEAVQRAYEEAAAMAPPAEAAEQGHKKGKGKGKPLVAAGASGARGTYGAPPGKGAAYAGSVTGGLWSAKRTSASIWNGGGASAGNAKRQHIDGGAFGTAQAPQHSRLSKGNGKGGFAAKGHPMCTQQDDCIGNASTQLFQHMDNDQPGDIYCVVCWAVFADADPSLQALPYKA